MRYLSPLRYPGGKARLAPFISALIQAQTPRPTMYAEPYAGGAGAALRLLVDGVVDEIYLNDLNAGIAAFWRTITDPDGARDFANLVRTTPVTIKEWQQQRARYEDRSGDDLTLGFATFFLNRTNRSGILDARPIGGMQQQGKWLINARYNKESLIDRIVTISQLGHKIHVTQSDGIRFLDQISRHGHDIFVYADPPYVEQGASLYLHAFNTDDHQRLSTVLLSAPFPWILTYDDQHVIWGELYSQERCARFAIAHTAAVQHVGSETLVYSPRLAIPPGLEVTPGVEAEWITRPAATCPLD